ncbi:site-specific DNA-methyltransferase [Planococcus dechangensis]|uniref:Site-specific DNA-methyltransferase n=1 Tax=Planococcus dechangensis TaxID=1176255 RepID=A0ABV9M7H1_9BACL
MGTNISQQKREEILNHINELRTKLINPDLEKSLQSELLAHLGEIEKYTYSKKFGLIFEEHIENQDLLLNSKVPYLREIEDLSISNDGKLNYLIEGDNLVSLSLLNKTHKNKVDMIYIDPPYNTGNKDFKYDDSFVANDDGFRHSKWLSFMDKRLRLAKHLLTQDGFIAISIDEIEFHALKMLCDDIFDPKNYVGEFIWKARSGKGGNDSYIAMQHEYILCYARNINHLNFRGDIKVSEKDGTEQLRQWGQNVYRKDRKTMFFPIFYKEKEFLLPSFEEVKKLYNDDGTEPLFNDDQLALLVQSYEERGYEAILPYIDNEYGRWRKGYYGVQELIDSDLLIIEGEVGSRVVKKVIPAGKETSTAVDSLLLSKGTASTGTQEIKGMFDGKKVFDTTKPLELIKYLIKQATFNKEEATILDFFAGSGTTAQAVLELNRDEEREYNFILCTNNEGDICREVTYERVRKVLQGYTYKGKKVRELFKLKLNFTSFKNANRHFETIEKIKQEEKENYNKFTTTFKDEHIKLFGEYSKEENIEGIAGSLKYFQINDIPIEDRMYYEFIDELIPHINGMIELEQGINLNQNDTVSIILTDEILSDFVKNIKTHPQVTKLYIGYDVLPSGEEEAILAASGIEIITIPDYYYDELWR